MTTAPLESYLAEVDPAAVPGLRALDAAIRAAAPQLDVAVKYRILMYALDGDWRHWVCAINATTRGLCLRFLYGVLMDDPLGVLRAGSATLMTWDLGLDDPVDGTAVGDYVREALAHYDHFRANAREINAASKAEAVPRRRPPRAR